MQSGSFFPIDPAQSLDASTVVDTGDYATWVDASALGSKILRIGSTAWRKKILRFQLHTTTRSASPGHGQRRELGLCG
jgi:hypothetical protein